MSMSWIIVQHSPDGGVLFMTSIKISHSQAGDVRVFLIKKPLQIVEIKLWLLKELTQIWILKFLVIFMLLMYIWCNLSMSSGIPKNCSNLLFM